MAQDTNLNPTLLLEFSLSVLEKRFDRDSMREILYDQLQTVVSVDDILGVSVVPFHSPRKVIIQCENQDAMDELLLKGLCIEGNTVELSQPGYGAVRVTMHNAPLEMSNAFLKDYLELYGTVTGFGDSHYFHKPTGTRTDWRTGSRFAFVKLHDMQRTIPPSDEIAYDINKKAKVLIYHDGQLEIHCRFCQSNVPHGHKCDKTTTRRCFNCNETDHVASKCPLGKVCHKCKKPGHISRNCRQTAPVQYQYNAQDYPAIDDNQKTPMRSEPKRDHISNVRGKIDTSPTLFSTPLAGNVQTVTSVAQMHAPPGGSDEKVKTSTENKTGATEDPSTVNDDEAGWEKSRLERKRQRRAEEKLSRSQNEIDVIEEGIQEDPKPKRKQKRKKGWNFKSMLNPGKIFGLATKHDSTLHVSQVDSTGVLEVTQPAPSEHSEETPPAQDSPEKTSDEKESSSMEVEDYVEETDETTDDENPKEVADNSSETVPKSPETDDNESDTSETDDDHEDSVSTEHENEKEEISVSEEEKQQLKQSADASSLVFDQPEYENHFLKLYSVGASNMAGLKMTGDENLEIEFVNLSRGGLNMVQAYEKLDEVHKEDRMKIKIVILNYGSVDFLIGKNDLTALQNKFERSLNRVRKAVPNAELILSSILPRNGEEFVQTNEDISEFNTFQRELCQPGKGMYYCNNYNFVLDAFFQLRSGLYKDDIHLNREGQSFLSESLFRTAKFVYFKNLLDRESLPEEFHYTPEEVESFLAPHHG